MPNLIFDQLKYSIGKWSSEFHIELAEERWHVVCGPSGAGKSTLINLASGILMPSSGDIRFGDHSIAHLPPHQRNMSFMGQADSLFPGISIFQNLLLSLHDCQIDRAEKDRRILTLTQSMGLDPAILTRQTNELSGGQLSRCNLARALLRPCRWLFLDEPFAAVDRPTRLQILDWLRGWMKENKITIVLIAHDLDDVYTVATDITVISDGRIVEHAPLQDALNKPKSLISARFLRAGLIINRANQNIFIPSSCLITSHSEAQKIPEQFRSFHTFTSPSATRVGPCIRVIDFCDANDVTLPFNADFDRTIWFDRRNALAIS